MAVERDNLSLFDSTIRKQEIVDGVVYSLYENGFFHVYFPKFKKINRDVINTGNAFMESIGGGRYYNIFELDNFADVEPEVREWAADSEGNTYTYTDAIVINSLPQKIIADFYLKFNKPVSPTKIFNSLEKAVKWTFDQKKLREESDKNE